MLFKLSNTGVHIFPRSRQSPQQSTVAENSPLQTQTSLMCFPFQTFDCCYPAFTVSKAADAIRGSDPPGVTIRPRQKAQPLRVRQSKAVCLPWGTNNECKRKLKANLHFWRLILIPVWRTIGRREDREIPVGQNRQLFTTGRRARWTCAPAAQKKTPEKGHSMSPIGSCLPRESRSQTRPVESTPALLDPILKI